MVERDRTIAAVSTPGGTGALGIIRITGEKTFELLSKCIKNREKFFKEEKRKISLNFIVDQKSGEFIDEVTIIKYGNPFSFTGENMVEIICHGGNKNIKRIMRELINAGVENAERGEFSKRAFINGKIDLMKAEAINEMIVSENEIQRKIALKFYQGRYRQEIEKIYKEVYEVLTELEAIIEFSEEDDVKRINIEKEKILKIRNQLEKEIKKREEIEEVETGIKIVIAGPANAGKSTLFNKILGYERSITYDEPGTTRDIINEKIIFKGNEVTITDSAGIRETKNKIEEIGIKKSEEEIKKAKILIWISGLDQELEEKEKSIINEKENSNTIVLLNKSDISANEEKEKYYKERKINYLKVCLFNYEDIERVIKKIEEKVVEKEEEIEIPDFVINNRHLEIAKKMIKEIECSIEEWGRYEIAAYYLHRTLNYLEEFNGKRDREEIYNNIFNKFCIGK